MELTQMKNAASVVLNITILILMEFAGVVLVRFLILLTIIHGSSYIMSFL